MKKEKDKDLMKLYKEATTKSNDNDMPFFKINTMECPLDKKFSRNFLDYFQIDKTQNEPIKDGKGCSASKIRDASEESHIIQPPEIPLAPVEILRIPYRTN